MQSYKMKPRRHGCEAVIKPILSINDFKLLIFMNLKFLGRFKSRKFENQETALYVKPIAINKMTNLRMPESKWITA